jgi:hypothetical protein
MARRIHCTLGLAPSQQYDDYDGHAKSSAGNAVGAIHNGKRAITRLYN